ncbi:MAG: ChbG/HpnK family deacetylase [Cyclobacteriaceae bacterium]
MKNFLVITADDYGACRFIDAGIDDAIEAGQITAVAALSNGQTEDWDRVVTMHEKYKDKIDVGCHLNITNGRPLLAWPKHNTRKYKGERLFKWILKLDFDKIDLGLLRDELEEQVERFEDANIPIKHFSDHFGVLSVLEQRVSAVMIDVVRDYNERHEVNVPFRNPFLSSVYADNLSCMNNSKLKRKARLANFIRKAGLKDDDNGRQLFYKNLSRRAKQLRRSGLKTTDFFIDQFYGVDESTKAGTIQCLMDHQLLNTKSKPPSTMAENPVFEMVVHLGKNPEELNASSDEMKFFKKYWKFNSKGLNEERPNELNILKDFHTRNRQDSIYQLTKFSDLSGS